jgi:hypothetical protein
MRSEAFLSEDRRFRYWLLRVWDESLPVLCFIGVNPSTADETKDDPTIRREIGFAKREGCGGILKLNLYAYRATKPADMWKAQKSGVDIIGGSQNWVDALKGYTNRFGCSKVVASWGRQGAKRGPDFVMRWPGMLCFGRNEDGTPKHTLYLKNDTQLVELEAR